MTAGFSHVGLRFVLLLVMVLFSQSICAQESTDISVTFKPRLKDSVIEKIKDQNKIEKEKNKADADNIRAKRNADAKAKAEGRLNLVASLPSGQFPTSVDQFAAVEHTSPRPQWYTGTCWSFSGVSFVESEVMRISGKKVSLSEMFIVYYEYIEKAREWVATRGESVFEEGSQAPAVLRMVGKYGLVPRDVYPGTLDADGYFNHALMHQEMAAFLAFARSSEQWNERFVLQGIAAILDRHMGRPPEAFEYEGRQVTPLEFSSKILGFRPGDYVAFQSTARLPWYAPAVLEYPDNWWKDASFINVPLSDFYGLASFSIIKGFSFVYGGDVSEPGKNYEQGIAFVAPFDIDSERIDDWARVYCQDTGATGDDHGVHVIGALLFNDHMWFLIKDSGRSAFYTPNPGYYFFRDDFIKLKMLSFVVHRDAVAPYLNCLEDEEVKNKAHCLDTIMVQ